MCLPGIEKNRLDIKKDEDDPHQVELDAEALAGASRRRDTAFVGRVLHPILDAFTD